jgi:GH25 family lysozyme M1 (1,4-beta-N-acetylmuramidase)
MIVGNDISKYQGSVDFNTFKNNSNFVIIKVSEGNAYVDPTFSKNQAEAWRVGLPLGYYHFARPDLGNTPESEANFFLKTIGSIKEGDVLCLDFEPSWSGDGPTWCKNFLSRVQTAIGVKCLIYMDQSRLKKWNWSIVSNEGFGLWVAAYTGSPTNNTFVTGSWKSAVMQQWTNGQNVPGIPASVDGDVFFGTITQFKAYGYKIPTPQPTPTPVDPKDKIIADLKVQLEAANKATDAAKKAGEDALATAKVECQTKLTTIKAKATDITALCQ